MQKLGLISIVDDEERVRRATGSLVRSLGHSVASFASAEEFLASEALDASVCVISDIYMPGMSGIDLHEVLRQRGSSPPFIFITASPEQSVRQRLGSQSCILQKPFDADVLADAIDQAINSSDSVAGATKE